MAQASAQGLLHGAQRGVGQAAQTPLFERLARLGFAAKGLVYLVIGVLALRLAVGKGGQTTDAEGAIDTIASGPLGQLLVALVGLGLLGYAVWRFAQSFHDEHGGDASGAAHRVGALLSGGLHAGLALYAWRVLAGTGGEGRVDKAQDWTAQLLQESWGVWLVTLIGAGLVGFGLYQFVKARKGTFMKGMRLASLPSQQAGWVRRLGQAGYAARGVVFGLTGVFVLLAALRSDATEVRGLEGSLDALAAQSYGPWLLGLVALGLAAYGAFMLVAARFRSVQAAS